MAKKKAEQIGQGTGIILVLALVAAVMAAALLPLYLVGAWVRNAWISRKLRKGFPAGGQVAWLSEVERQRFKKIHPDCIALRDLVDAVTERSEHPGLARNEDGSLDLGNSENMQINRQLGEARDLLDGLETELADLESKTFLQWHELNDALRKCSRMWMAFLGWLIGAAFLYSKSRAGAPFNIWIDFVVLALCAGGGVLFAMVFSRYPAGVYSPMPAPVDMDNVDSPDIRRPMHRRSKVLQFSGAFAWSALMITAAQRGKEVGAAEAIAYRQRIGAEQTLKAENEKIIQSVVESKRIVTNSGKKASPGTILERPSDSGSTTPGPVPSPIDSVAIDRVITSQEIAGMDRAEVGNMILALYARAGAVFESESAARWTYQQPWYRRGSWRTIKDAEKDFSPVAQHNVNQLIARWNQLPVEERPAPDPVDENPLAGGSVSPAPGVDNESSEPAVMESLPASDGPAVRQGRFNPEELESWEMARVRTEINTIYARHGVVFPDKELQEWAVSQSWYQPVRGLTFDQAEERFSVEERQDIAGLVARRDRILGEAPTPEVPPLSEPLNPELVATWDASRVQLEINAVYARHGVAFPNRKLQAWADKQPWYQRVPGRTFGDVDASMGTVDRHNIALLAARRSEIKNGGR